MFSEGTSDFLNAARWISALTVLIYHTKQNLFPQHVDLHGATLSTKAFFVATAFGHEAVIVFFVISGFLVGGISSLKALQGRFSLKDYAIGRFSRIYVVLVPALLLTGVLDQAGLSLFGQAPAYDQAHVVDGVTRLDASSLTVAVMLGNMLMLSGICVDQFGSNGPIWSLVCEWWYYVIFGAVVVAVTSRSLALRLAATATAAGVLSVLSVGTLVLGLVWLLGAVVFHLARRGHGAPPPLPCLVLFGIVTLATHALRPPYAGGATPEALSLAYDLAVGIAFSLLLLSVVRRAPARWRFATLHRAMADFSYSLYLTHYPVMLIVVAALGARSVPTAPVSILGPTLLVFAAAVGAAYGLALLTYLVFERQTDRVRRALLGLFERDGAGRLAWRPGQPQGL